MKKTLRFGSVLLAAMALGNCAGLDTPDNLEPVAAGDGYQAQYRAPDVSRGNAQFLRSAAINAQKCRAPRGGTGGKGAGLAASALRGERVTRNDLVDVRIGDDDTFNGDYVVSRDGTIKLPFLPPIRAQGRLTSEIESDIARQLIAGDFFVDRPRARRSGGQPPSGGPGGLDRSAQPVGGLAGGGWCAARCGYFRR